MRWLIALALLLATPDSGSLAQVPGQALPVAALPIPPAWTTFQDPQEQAFTLDVPQNWRVQGGTLRHNALQFRNWVQVASPDGGTIIDLNDPEEPSYVVPSPLLAMAGFHIGSLYNGGGGTLYIVKPYLNGAQAAAQWGLRQLPRLCRGIKLTSTQELPSLTEAVNALSSAFGVHHDAGQAEFTCNQSGVPLHAYVLMGVTSISGQGGTIWYPEEIEAWVARAPLAGVAAGIAAHMVQSIRINPNWLLNTLHTDLAVSRIAVQTNQAISSDIMQTWANDGAVFDRIMGEASRERLGIDIYRDPATGTTYTVANTHNYYWANPQRVVVGTDTDTAPPGFTPLSRVPPGQ